MTAEAGVLLLFCTLLLASLLLGLPLVGALLAGLAIFMAYGRCRGISWRKLAGMAASGVWQARKILVIFVLIGALSAVWRCSGTIASLVCYCCTLVRPPVFLLAAFLLNSMVSFLTGTSFGTSATMGVICMTMGTAIGVPPAAAGGAILSGAFFGDRCSPVSSSALLVADVTGTDIYQNIRRMLRTGAVPLALTCVIYLTMGLLLPHAGAAPELRGVLGGEFVIHPVTLVPALLIAVLSALRVDVRITLAAGIAAALPVCLAVQHTPAGALAGLVVNGFAARSEAAGALMNGGGILSMGRVAAIVCISSAYSGVFRSTGLLDGLRRGIERLAARTSPFAAELVTSVLGAAVSCNQTLSIMLTNQLCERCQPDRQVRAIDLENSAVVVAPLIPWSIAGSVPLATIGAPQISLLLAVYLYLIPAWQLIAARQSKKTHKEKERSA